MDFKIMDYSEFHKDNIAMSGYDWAKARNSSNEEIMRVYWERIVWPEGYPDCLKGLSIPEQLERFAVRECSKNSRTSYGEIEKSSLSSGGFIPLQSYKRFCGVIVRDGIVIGAIIENYYHKQVYLHPGCPVCIYWSIDTDGTGSSSSDEYVQLYCLSVK